MKITRVTIGVLEGNAEIYELEPHAEGVTIVPTANRPADVIASSLRHILTRPDPSALPFAKITLVTDDAELEVADDAGQSLRMLAISSKGSPLLIEAGAGDDERIDALLSKVSAAAGLEDAEQLAVVLAMGPESDAHEASEEEVAYVEAQRRAARFAAEVRRIDDWMTQSVVPDWLWVATGFGGLGVFLTAVVFLYPETRLVLIPALIALSIVGFALYGWRSWQELRVRGRLQMERAEVRAQREKARHEARERGAVLRDPDATMARLAEIVIPKSVPAILSRAPEELDAVLRLDRQAIVFVNGEIIHERAKPLIRAHR